MLGGQSNYDWQLWCFFMDHFCYLCFLFVMFSHLFIAPLWSAPGIGLTSWLSCLWYFIVFLSLSHMVSKVRCGAWLYRFLIVASFSKLLSSLTACRRVGPQTLWRFWLKDLSIDEMVGAWCLLGFDCWISFAQVFSCMYCWVTIFVLYPFCISVCMY